MTRLVSPVVAFLFLGLTFLPAEAHAQRYAYLVRDCISACVGQQLLVFDAATGTAVTQIQLAVDGNGQPTLVPGSKQLAISPEGRRAYVTFDERIVVVDLTTNTVLGQFSGVNIAAYPVVSPDGQRLYLLNQPSANTFELKVLSTATGATLATHPLTGLTTASELTISSDEATAAMAITNGFAALTLATGDVRVFSLTGATDVALHPGNVLAYVMNDSHEIREVSLATMTQLRAAIVDSQFGPMFSLAISPDGTRLYAGGGGNTLLTGSINYVDTGTLETTLSSAAGGAYLRVSPSGAQVVYVGNSTGTSNSSVVGLASTDQSGQLSLGAYDRTTQTIRDVAVGPDLSCSMSAPTPSSATFTSAGGTGTITVPAPTGCAWTATSNQDFVTITSGQGGDSAGTVSYSVAANALGTSRSATITIAGHLVTITQDANPNVIVATPSRLAFGATLVPGSNPSSPILDRVTSPQTVQIAFPGGAAMPWTASVDVPWMTISPTSGTGASLITVRVTSLPAVDPAQGHVRITATGTSLTLDIPVVLRVIRNTVPPIGQVDSPATGVTGVQGSLAFTGWALDEIEVDRVEVYRGCLSFDVPTNCNTIAGQSVVFVGVATLVPGARPDVEAAYSEYPFAYRAGWGINILTPMLPDIPAQQPHGGVGTMTLYTVAVTGGIFNRTYQLLGRTTIDQNPTTVTLANDTIAKPFGAIDTPGQGARVSGALNNFGWALTPDPGTSVLIPTDGSTINVFIDGASIGSATYNLCRGTVGNPVPAGVLCDDDVSTIFRGVGTRFRNLDAARGPIGLRSIDTTTLTNGLHTISWGVTDSANRSEGIGSRYFTVLNGSADAAACSVECEVRSLPAEALAQAGAERGDSGTSGLRDSVVYARTGFDLLSAYTPLVPDANGIPQVRIPELGRVELQIPGVTGGALLVNGEARSLPIGVGIDTERGIVTWAPGVGYLGTYRLTFEVQGSKGPRVLDVMVAPASTADEPLRMHLDSPALGLVLSERSVRVEGWALDPQSHSGAGVGAVHVWGRRIVQGPTELARRSLGAGGSTVHGSEPVFLGVADINIPRPDVAAAHGGQYPDAGFRLQTTLPAGEWEVTAYVWVSRTGRFEDARSVRVVMK